MKKLKSIDDIIVKDLCISCGACVSSLPEGKGKMILDSNKGIYVPQLDLRDDNDIAKRAFDVCPGKGLAIDQISEDLFGDTPHKRYELGRYRIFFAAHASDRQILEHASSGGVITTIAAYLLNQGLIQGVTASRFVYGNTGPRVESFMATSLEDLISAQGSKYCPTSTNTLITQCRKQGGAFLFSGTPCHIEALRLAQQQDSSLKELFPYTIANFCAGYRDYRHLDGMIRYDQMDPEAVTYFRFRGGGQPGSLKAEDKNGRTISAPYPDYDRRTQITKQKRCVYCIDATGELADFSCGDAWLDRLLETDTPWSIILGRSKKAEQILKDMIQEGILTTTDVTEDEICYSQRQNLQSKKFRQRKRMILSKLFGIALPQWDVQLVNQGSYLRELRTLFGKTRLGLKWRNLKQKYRR
ncbi:MAG: Coenzyme F420 hydrogenase/dehydrogenase, beta subunit C-terminal domain [Desulfobacterales bacterium]|nr:Coenzyme F420 hydrogenase/dehydrogenase, beta subunit C-terminal domain [Desulfobacterales bacterium]